EEVAGRTKNTGFTLPVMAFSDGRLVRACQVYGRWCITRADKLPVSTSTETFRRHDYSGMLTNGHDAPMVSARESLEPKPRSSRKVLAVMQLWETIVQLFVVLGQLVVQLLQLGLAYALVIAYVAWCLWGI